MIDLLIGVAVVVTNVLVLTSSSLNALSNTVYLHASMVTNLITSLCAFSIGYVTYGTGIGIFVHVPVCLITLALFGVLSLVFRHNDMIN